jgi:hypothetical protein
MSRANPRVIPLFRRQRCSEDFAQWSQRPYSRGTNIHGDAHQRTLDGGLDETAQGSGHRRAAPLRPHHACTAPRRCHCLCGEPWSICTERRFRWRWRRRRGERWRKRCRQRGERRQRHGRLDGGQFQWDWQPRRRNRRLKSGHGPDGIRRPRRQLASAAGRDIGIVGPGRIIFRPQQRRIGIIRPQRELVGSRWIVLWPQQRHARIIGPGRQFVRVVVESRMRNVGIHLVWRPLAHRHAPGRSRRPGALAALS